MTYPLRRSPRLSARHAPYPPADAVPDSSLGSPSLPARPPVRHTYLERNKNRNRRPHMHGARNESQLKIGPPSCLQSNTSKFITENAETILKMKDNIDWHDFVEQLQLNLQCPVCYDPPYQPYTLECGHLFCAKCLMEARPQTEKSNTGFRCPLCNVPTTRTPHPVHAVRHCLEIMANGAGKTMPMPVVWSWEPMRPRPCPLTARSSQNPRSGSA